MEMLAVRKTKGIKTYWHGKQKLYGKQKEKQTNGHVGIFAI